MRNSNWNSQSLLSWYERLGDGALLKTCERLLKDVERLECTGCGYVKFRLGDHVSGDYYERLSEVVPMYFPKQRDEWLKVAGIVNNMELEHATRVIDIGCGSGAFFQYIDQRVCRLGIDFEDYRKDPSEFAFQAKNLNASFDLPDADIYTSFHVLEHVESPRMFLESIISSAKPGSSIFISVPNSENYRNFSVADPLNQPPHHLNNFSKESLVRLFSNFDLKFEVIGVEKISLARIVARLYNQTERRLCSKAVFNTMVQRLRDSNLSFESYLVSAVKGVAVE
jgi:2-polyprenyl-3-methyl-5-hydroxy-6-metoxy-1,4-benzoquinol methylase